jgi:hypothetical protein
MPLRHARSPSSAPPPSQIECRIRDLVRPIHKGRISGQPQFTVHFASIPQEKRAQRPLLAPPQATRRGALPIDFSQQEVCQAPHGIGVHPEDGLVFSKGPGPGEMNRGDMVAGLGLFPRRRDRPTRSRSATSILRRRTRPQLLSTLCDRIDDFARSRQVPFLRMVSGRGASQEIRSPSLERPPGMAFSCESTGADAWPIPNAPDRGGAGFVAIAASLADD